MPKPFFPRPNLTWHRFAALSGLFAAVRRGGLLLCFLLGLSLLTGEAAWGQVGGNPNNPPGEKGLRDDPCDKEGGDLGSIKFNVSWGRGVFDELSGGMLKIHKKTPSLDIYDPSIIYYTGIAGQKIWEDYEDYYLHTRTVSFLDNSGVFIYYRFSDGKETGFPTKKDQAKLSRAYLLNRFGNIIPYSSNENGGSQNSIATHMEIRHSDGSGELYSFQTKQLVGVKGRNGIYFNLSDIPELARPEVIWDESTLRQVKTAEGLADVARLPDEVGFQVRLYPLSQVGVKVDGVYSLSGEPYRVVQYENPDPESPNPQRMKITDTWGSKVREYMYTYQEALDDWVLDRGNGASQESKELASAVGANPKVYRRVLRDSANQVVSTSLREEWRAPWGEVVITKETKDPQGLNQITTYEYHTTEGEPGYGQLKSVSYPDGSWVRYAYDAQGRTAKQVRPWLDSPVDAPENAARVTEYLYVSHDSSDTVAINDGRARTVIEKIAGVETSRTYHVYGRSSSETFHIEERAASQGAAYGATGSQRTTTTYYGESSPIASRGRIKSIGYSDARQTSYSYSLNETDTDAFLVTTSTEGTVSSPAGVANKSLRYVETQDVAGRTRENVTQVYASGGYATLTTVQHDYSADGLRIQSRKDGRTTYNAAYAGDLRTSATDEVGIVRSYTYDALDRVITETKQGVNGQSDIVTTYNRTLGGLDCGCDAELVTTVSAGGLSLTSTVKKDQAGRITESVDTAGLVTTYVYTNGGRTVTILHPNTATEIRENYLDGQTKSVRGSGVIAQHYTYGVDGGGTQWTKVNAVSANSPRWSKSTTDFLGRSWKTEQPGFGSGAVVTSLSTYNALGQLATQAVETLGGTTASAPRTTMYTYDALGNVTATATAFTGESPVTTLAEQNYVQESGKWFSQSRQQVQYVESGSSKTVTTGLNKRQVGGFSGNIIAYSESFSGPFDVNGESVNQTVQSTTLERSTQTVVSTVLYPTSDQPAIQTTIGGLLVSSVSPTHGGTTLYQYDALGRQTGQKEPRHSNYSTITYNAQGQISAITDAAGNTTSYTYRGNGTVGAGQLHQETNALGQTTFHQYDLLGRETYTWGSATYPVAQGYNVYGQRNLLRTFRDTNANFAGASFPTGVNGDTTTWSYDEATGVLLQKTYADGKGPSYDHFADGKLKTRTWARKDANNNPLTTTYTYTPKGELAQVDYSDDTPDVSYTYNALGQQTSITDGAGTRTFSYDVASLNLVAENFAGTVNGTLHRTYDTYNRPTGYALANAAGDDILTAATYGFDNRGRFSQVHGDTVPAGISIAHNLSPLAFNYTRVANSDLISTVTGPAHTVNNTYETNRDILLSKQNATLSNSIVSQFDYSVNPIGQRTSRSQTGTAFTAISTDTFAYNPRGEVISSTNDINPTLDREYAYDPIGNRLTATEGDETKSYTANNLNQYLSVTSASSVVNPSYDADGNMLTDGEGKTYTWDGENRLIQVTLPNSEIVRYSYDGQSRRVKREHFSSAATETTTYLYDGWNVIAEWHSPTSGLGLLTSRIWGLDLSYGLQGAGGVGGLLASIAHGPSPIASFPTYDGNGNVSDLLGSQGTVKAHYEYDAFGKETLAIGDWAQENTYRFSTKSWDTDTKLSYYGYRFYDPDFLGWMSRDPSSERSGINLYRFIEQDSINKIDVLGLWPSRDSMDWFYVYARTHREITKIAWTKEKDLLGKVDGAGAEVFEYVVKYNHLTDGKVGDENLFDNPYYHYNRRIGESSTSASDGYRDLLNKLYGEFFSNVNAGTSKGCERALQVIGHISHMYQDYYAHGIQALHFAGSDEQGRFTYEGERGNPGDIKKGLPWAQDEKIIPSSFGAVFGNWGEHGTPFWEPAYDAADGGASRWWSAVAVTQVLLSQALPIWAERCCLRDGVFYPRNTNRN